MEIIFLARITLIKLYPKWSEEPECQQANICHCNVLIQISAQYISPSKGFSCLRHTISEQEWI